MVFFSDLYFVSNFFFRVLVVARGCKRLNSPPTLSFHQYMPQTTVVGMAAFPPPLPFLAIPGLPLKAWSSWKQGFLSFLGASGLDDTAPKGKKQIPFLMPGLEGQRIVTAFRIDAEPVAEGVNELDAFVSALNEHQGR
uniref:Putative polyprotein n=1 Tax=Ixodes ricinus TaxID=34613 RepID=A0A6B0USG9_IXORI